MNKRSLLIPLLCLAPWVAGPRSASAEVVPCGSASNQIDLSNTQHVVSHHANQPAAQAAMKAFTAADWHAIRADLLSHFYCEFCPAQGGYCAETNLSSPDGDGITLGTGFDMVAGDWVFLLDFGNNSLIWKECSDC